jgi:hypothetical protein
MSILDELIGWLNSDITIFEYNVEARLMVNCKGFLILIESTKQI